MKLLEVVGRKELHYNNSMKRNVEVIQDCVAEVWSGMTQIDHKGYVRGDLIRAFSSEVDGNDVIVTDEYGLTMYFPIDCVSV